ncbi:MAG: hypothetical protein K0R63_1483 [Rickettsiales bacterium]|jgi:hypothetical protein|nr:hypothetical protein [Rickettsiales bacterium]
MSKRKNTKSFRENLNQKQARKEQALAVRYNDLHMPPNAVKVLAAAHMLKELGDYDDYYVENWEYLLEHIELQFRGLYSSKPHQMLAVAPVFFRGNLVENQAAPFMYFEERNTLYERLRPLINEVRPGSTDTSEELFTPFWEELHNSTSDDIGDSDLGKALYAFFKKPNLSQIAALQDAIENDPDVSDEQRELLHNIVHISGVKLIEASFPFVTMCDAEQSINDFPHITHFLRDVLRYGMICTHADMTFLTLIHSGRPYHYRGKLQEHSCTETTYQKALKELDEEVLQPIHMLLHRDMRFFFSAQMREKITALQERMAALKADNVSSLQERRQALSTLYTDTRTFSEGQIRPFIRGKYGEVRVPVEAAEQIDYYQDQLSAIKAYRRIYEMSLGEGLTQLTRKQAKALLQRLVESEHNYLPPEHPVSFANCMLNPEKVSQLSRDEAIEYLRDLLNAGDEQGVTPVAILQAFHKKATEELQGNGDPTHNGGMSGLIETLKHLMEVRPGVINPKLLKTAESLNKEIQREYIKSLNTLYQQQYQHQHQHQTRDKRASVDAHIDLVTEENKAHGGLLKGKFVDLSGIDLRGINLSGMDMKHVNCDIEQLAVARHVRDIIGLTDNEKMQIKQTRRKINNAAEWFAGHDMMVMPLMLQSIGQPNNFPYSKPRAEAVLQDINANHKELLEHFANFQVRDIAITLMKVITEKVRKNRKIGHPDDIYAGIGVVITQNAKGQVLLNPMTNLSQGKATPASEVINGQVVLTHVKNKKGKWVSVVGMSPEDVGPMFKGLVGTTLEIKFQQNGINYQKTFYRQLINAHDMALETFTDLKNTDPLVMSFGKAVYKTLEESRIPDRSSSHVEKLQLREKRDKKALSLPVQ